KPYDIIDDTQRADIMTEQVLCGSTLVESDRMMTLNDYPALQLDDRIVFHKAGASTIALQPLFIEFLPAVYARTEEELFLVRRKWTSADYVQGSYWPEATRKVESDALLQRPINAAKKSLLTQNAQLQA